MESKQEFIRRIAWQNRLDPEGESVRWSRHSITELLLEGWTRTLIEDALHSCEVIEDYPAVHRPPPDCLVLGWLESEVPFHAVVAVDEANDRLFIVTVYKPNPARWEDDWKTRK